MQKQLSPKVIYAVLGVLVLSLLVLIGRSVVTPAPVLKNPALEREPTR
ncbi:MAG: hypothetical protein H7145_14470 [Akkermansiaceae bacterium]|nr:hypothetical protein [Armatimonadota bacterium]